MDEIAAWGTDERDQPHKVQAAINTLKYCNKYYVDRAGSSTKSKSVARKPIFRTKFGLIFRLKSSAVGLGCLRVLYVYASLYPFYVPFFFLLYRFLYSYKLLVAKLVEYFQGTHLDPRVLAEKERVQESKFSHPIITIPKSVMVFNATPSIFLPAEMNVKVAAFTDNNNNYFEEESNKHKELLTAVPTVANPFAYLPEGLQKLVLKCHPHVSLFKIDLH